MLAAAAAAGLTTAAAAADLTTAAALPANASATAMCLQPADPAGAPGGPSSSSPAPASRPRTGPVGIGGSSYSS
jgi:hypothetical protein